ncbi:hypothetical protein [Streptomyces sp. CC224B]|nr:hypothetical protein [Streptomyces sp. CC224B]
MAEQSRGIPVPPPPPGPPEGEPEPDPRFETVYDPERGGHYPPGR